MGIDPVFLVTGGSGQVGCALRAALPHARFFSRSELDILDENDLARACKGVDAVIHLAAYTDVDGCEASPQRAALVNEVGTSRVVSAAQRMGASVVYLSTDYVFDGTKDGEYRESDTPNPLNAYGKSKLGGEAAVAAYSDNLIIRTSWIFGGVRNFVSSIVQAAKGSDFLNVVDDQMGRPTPVSALATGIVHLVRERHTGLIHLAGAGTPCTWRELAEEAIAATPFRCEVRPVSSEAFRRSSGRLVAPRPANSALALDLAREKGVTLEEWRPAVRQYAESLV